MILVVGLCLANRATAATTIDPSNRFAYAANAGWLDCRADTTNGVVVGQFVCSGFLYGANVGWVNLGTGNPTNGFSYGNASTNDFGVNHDGHGNLRGLAWGANIGWLNFETNGAAAVNLRTGDLSGFVWAQNVGWIGLSNALAFVRTLSLDVGPDSDSDTIPDQWEYQQAGNLITLSNAMNDADNDGMSDTEEYAADTNPTNDMDRLEITSLTAEAGTNTVQWTSRPTRLYRVMATNALTASGGSWEDVGGGLLGPPATSPARATIPDGGTTQRFYRIRVVMPFAE